MFSLTTGRLQRWGAYLLALAVAVVAGGAAIGGPFGTVFAAIGSTIATIAFVSLIVDPVVKDLLAQEIFARVGLRDTIVAAGIEDIAAEGRLSFPDPLRSSEFLAAPLDPLAWAKDVYPEIMRAADEAATAVTVILQAPNASTGRATLAQRLQLSENELERLLRALSDDMLAAWDSNVANVSSTLKILEHERALSSGLVVWDGGATIETGPAIAQSSTDRTSLLQRFASQSPFAGWAGRQITALRDHQETRPVGERPLTPPSELPTGRANAQRQPGTAEESHAE